MNSLLDEADPQHDRSRPSGGQDREITLGTTMILLVFFGLAVYGAILFGFGYSLGSKHTSTTASAAASPGSSGTSFGGSKPSPGSPINGIATNKPPTSGNTPATIALPTLAKTEIVDSETQATLAETAAAEVNTIKPHPATPAALPQVAAPGTSALGTIVVQVAAVSHQEDADMIASTLKKRGYLVTVRAEPDKLIHVQVGPFTTHKDADAMKARLLADGFNAYIK